MIGWCPLGPLKAPNQNEQQWSREWKRAKWCSCFKWCYRAFPLYALKVVNSVPCWRWFGYTLTHSSVVSLLSPSHPSRTVMKTLGQIIDNSLSITTCNLLMHCNSGSTLRPQKLARQVCKESAQWDLTTKCNFCR
jgi:hypothetical protein